MHFQRMVVLANSYKRGGRCVAGRLPSRDVPLNRWLRPISDIDHGTLMPHHMIMADRRPIVPLDIVEVPLLRNAMDFCHPEDWHLSVEPWRRIGRLSLRQLAELEEEPECLWLEDRHHTDRITCAFHKQKQRFQSLHLIRPRKLQLRLWTERNEKGEPAPKTRAVFRYARVEYALSLTDPVILKRYPQRHPALGEPPAMVSLPFDDECLLCVSLTPLWNDYHYKIVATVLELQ